MHRLIQKSLPILYGAYFNGLSYLSKTTTARQAFRTFSKVRKGRLLPQQRDFLENARSHRELVAGQEIQTYHWKGSRDTVLLVHGWESNSFRWHNLIALLKSHDFDIWALDAPGHGASSGEYFNVPLYSECILHLIKKYQPAHLIGHSVGGMTALYATYTEPANGVRQIVTIGSPSEFEDIMEHYRQLLGLNARVMRYLDEYVKDIFGFHIYEFSSSRFARSLRQKGLLFHDRYDKVAPFRASENVHANWARSILVATEGLGHSMHQDTINKRILDFLVTGK